MMSRSTPGSRRNSGRSDTGMEMIIEASPNVDHHDNAFMPSTAFPGQKRPTTSASASNYRPPTRGSTATLNSSGGRHSLDDSSYSNSIGGTTGGPRSAGEAGSVSLDRSASLRLVQNRHSVGNLYHHPPGGSADAQAAALAASYLGRGSPHGTHLQAPYTGEPYERRKSSSALGSQAAKLSGLGPQPSGPFMPGIYSRFLGQDDSCQYLLQQSANQLSQPQQQQISDQDTSPLSSDDDIDNLLMDDSNQNSDQNTPSGGYPGYRPQSSASMLGGGGVSGVTVVPEGLPSQPIKKLSDPKLNQLTVIDSNKLSIASIDDPSRYSGM